MTDLVLPDNQWGMSTQYFNTDVIPKYLPHRDTLAAANAFNRARYALTTQQRMFVESYLSNKLNATQAAFDSGFAAGVDNLEAARIGRRVLARPYIQNVLKLALDYYGESTKIRRADLIDELKKIAFYNPADFFKKNDNGDAYVDLPLDDRDKMAAIGEIQIDVVKEGRGDDAREILKIKFKPHDKMGAIRDLLKIADRDEGVVERNIDGSTVTNTTNNFAVQTFNILPVPRGEFIPAPPNPYAAQTLDLSPMTEVVPNQIDHVP